MKPISALSDSEIDSLILMLFNGVNVTLEQKIQMAELGDDELKRIRSKNHPDKWPHVDLSEYQAAVQEIDRRRHARRHPNPA